MSEMNSRSRTLTTVVIYLAVISAALGIAVLRSRASSDAEESTIATATDFASQRPLSDKPYFSLSSHRTFGTNERPRIWVDFRGVGQLDFRVYRVKDPVSFFSKLDDPHQMGEREEEELTASTRRVSVLERVRFVKRVAYNGIKSFIRTQLQRPSRQGFNQKFRAESAPLRTPLNVADYARVPLLNPDQLVSHWREPLPPLEDDYDRRLVPLTKREAGVYLVEAVNGDLRAYTIVVVTDLTMVDKTSRDGELLIYAVDRRTGEPRPGAQVEIVRNRATVAGGTTDSQGLLRTKISTQSLNGTDDQDIDPGDGETRPKSFLILARDRDNFAISDLESFFFGGFDEGDSNRVRSYVYTDRPVYRPAQKVYFKGILREIDARGGYRPLQDQSITVSIDDSNGSPVYTGEARLSSRGTFSGEFDLTEEAPLGHYQITAELEGGTARGSFEVAEYKKPEYKVKVEAPGRFIPAGEKTKFAVEARYFFGAPVANAEVTYYLYRSRYYFWGLPEAGDQEGGEESEDELANYYSYGSDMVQEGEGVLNKSGQMEIEFQIPPVDENDASDYSYRIEVQVTDAARRTIDGSASFVATRGNIVARATTDRYVYYKGDVARIHVTTSDYEGRPAAAKVQLRFVDRTWKKVQKEDGGYKYTDYELQEREISSAMVETDSQGQAVYTYTAEAAGNIGIKTIIDEGGKQIASLGGYLWVTDRQASWFDDAYYREDTGSIKLIPDKKSYRPGETAQVLAILPTDNAHLLVTTELWNVSSVRQVDSPGRSVMLEVPIEASYAPNVFLSVTYVKDGDMYTSNQRLVVPPRDRFINLEIISNKQEYKPRETASYTILARNEQGAPVPGAEVSLGVVDEAIYSISPDYSGNIRTEFYGLRYSTVQTHLAINYSFIGFAGEKPMYLAKKKPAYELADFKNEGSLVEAQVRKLFKDTAFWQPDLVTGADGKATVKVNLPDNLTTWRATARAVTADTKVGATTYKVLARKDVIMRLETPRFVTQGDTLTFSGIVHNYLKTEKTTQISIAVDGAQLLSPATQTVSIPQQGEQRIDWQVSAPNVGQLKLLAKALTDTESDAVELAIEIVPRGLRQTKTETWTTGDENADRTFVLDLPSDADALARNLRLEAAPSVAGSLFGALDYLTTYPYGCTEQTMSSFLPNVVVAHALKDVKSASIRRLTELEKKVQKGLDRLYAFQHGDGGWGWWKDDQTDPFMTPYVVSGLVLAKQAGYQIDQDRLDRGREKLRQLIEAGKTDAGTAIDTETRAFIVYALEESGGADSGTVDRLYAERGSLQAYGRALLALTLKQRKDDKRAREIAAEIENSAINESVGAYWESRRKEMLDFVEQNDTEATALSLKALARIKPDSPVLPNAARWLVSSRRHGHYWSSTKDTAFAILGLIDYLKVSRELSPDYELEIYVNGETVLTQRITAASVSQSFGISRKGNAIGGTNQVRVVKRGRGMLYFSSSLDYHSGGQEVAARGSAALNLTREYLRLKLTEDGYRLKWALEPLTGEIHSGDVIVVRLRLNGTKARRLMIEDPIPAGAEQVKNVGNLNLDYTAGNGWSDWYSAREFRDNRTVFFLDYFDGDATFQYAMRIQVPGQFQVAPARAELMYQPSIQSNTTSGNMNFLDRK